MAKEQLLSLKDAANYRGVPVQDIMQGIEVGALPAEERGGAWFVRPEDLDGWEPHVHTAAGADFTDQEAADYLRTPGTPG